MKCTTVETTAKPRLGTFAQALQLKVADLVATGLPRPATVAFNLAACVVRREAGVVDKIRNRLLAAPTARVQTSVYYEPAGAEERGLQHSEPAEWLLIVGPQLVGELLRT
jgi:hypothetical protein